MKIATRQVYSFTQQGGRDYQEDSRFPDSNTPLAGQNFFVVCDGVGGSERGDLASQTVCSSMGKSLRALEDDTSFSLDDFSHVLDNAYNALDRVAQSSGETDMGTTLAFVALSEEGLLMAHIGDSRIYHMRPDKGIVYRSNDHSLVNNMVHEGMITPEEATNHSQRNVITRCMEPTDQTQRRAMATVVQTKDVHEGDYVFICSDGVLHDISDDMLQDIIFSKDSDEVKMNKIAEISKDSSDNNTAFFIPIGKVVGDTDNMENVDEVSSSRETKRLDTQSSTISEVESVTRPKQKGLRTWIRDMFNI